MSEWWTYELSNFLLFSPRTYDRLLESYNHTVWPWHLMALLSGFAVLLLAARERSRRDSLVLVSILALAWAWVGWAFLLERYAPINWAARWAALAFAVQAALLVATELARKEETKTAPRFARVGGLLVSAFAIGALPLLERALGRPWTQVEVFAIFPDATALATLGILVARRRVDVHLVVIPFLWCLAGAATLAALGRPDAVALVSAALLAIAAFAWKSFRRAEHGARNQKR